MIRPATMEDIGAIVDMGTRFLRESEYAAVMQPSRMHLAAFAARLLEREDAVIFLAFRAQQPVGMLAAYVFEHPYSGERTASELVWWVEPEHRGVGVRLLKAAEHWAKEQGATVIQMIAPNRHVGEFYRRVGYRPVETVFQRKVA